MNAEIPEDAAAQVDSDAVRARPRALRVMIVEDSPPVRMRIRSMIEESGTADIIGEADSIIRALALFHEHHPEAVVLDLRLPDGKSFPVLAEIKRTDPACLVMVLTNEDNAENRARCLQMGADYILKKSREFERVPEVLKGLRA